MHRPFQSYPAKRRTVIFYDHETHRKQYFPDNPTFARSDCRDCHDLADDGRRMVNQSLTVMCLDCHGRGTEGPVMGPPGVVFLNPPGFDVDTLADKGLGVGQWPIFAEAPPSALTRMMLTGDPDTAAALERLDGKPLMDLTDAPPEVLEDVRTLAWGMKDLLLSLRDQGPKAALTPRLERVLGRAPTEEEVKGLAGGLPRDVLAQAIAHWFPNLDAEMAAYGKGELVPTVPLMDGKPIAALEVARPTPPEETETEEGGGILGADSSILGEEGGSILGEESSILGDEGSILGEESSILGGEDGGLLGGDEALPNLEDLMSEPEPKVDTAGDATSQNKAGGLAAPDWANLGGWFQDDFAILYRPAEVIDDTIHKWIDLAGAPGFTHGGTSPFQDLAAPDAVSACGKCHGFTGTPETGLSLEWIPQLAELPAQGTTVFRHAPHVTAPQAEGCLSCHVLEENSAALQASFKQNNALDFRSNFTPMTVDQCATCHKPEESALDACATCHRYHPGGMAPAFPGWGIAPPPPAPL
jgi:cytochrome c553